MATLLVRRFSCIEHASLTLSPLTVLIGPQASGKSVLSKLIYFFYDTMKRQAIFLEEGEDFSEFSDATCKNFRKWFPPQAWGERSFSIRFSAGAYRVKLSHRAGTSDHLSIQFSEFVKTTYESILATIRQKIDSGVDDFFELASGVRPTLTKVYSTNISDDYLDWQLFIPAARSFFTSVGKAISAFEYGGLLDPITIRFGKAFLVSRDRGIRQLRIRRPNEKDSWESLMQQLFGGQVIFSREDEFVLTPDGRRIPFSTLSSGQQELLPLWLTLDYYVSMRRKASRYLIYIEEPEAHLFPIAQDTLVEYLASFISMSHAPYGRMIITTHSPYILAKLNNLIKAGDIITKNHELLPKVVKIVPRSSILLPKATTAYAIIDNKLRSIMDSEGLIDGEYLDSISGKIASQFSKLLEIEGNYDDNEVSQTNRRQ